MTKKNLSRRNFIGKTAVGFAGAAMTMSAKCLIQRLSELTTGSISDFLDAVIGAVIIRVWLKTSEKDKNLGVVAVCDIWKLNREKAAADL